MDSVQKAIEKVQLFSTLPPGWCQGYEIPPSTETIDFACRVIKKISPLGLHIDAFPGDEDSVRISVLNGDHSLDFDVHKNCFLSFTEEKGIGFQYEELDYKENPSFSEILGKIFSISNFVQQTWRTVPSYQELEYSSLEAVHFFAPTVTTYRIGEMMETDTCSFASWIPENIIRARNATLQTVSDCIREASLYLKKNAQKNKAEQYVNTYLNVIQQSVPHQSDIWKYPKSSLPVSIEGYTHQCV